MLQGKIIDFSSPKVMAIINVTPDSFYDGGRNMDEISLLVIVDRAVANGATLLDVGGCSTRPDAEFPSEEVEWQRVSRALKLIRSKYPTMPISIDTFRASVAEKAVAEFGVEMINDVSGGSWDEKMLPTVARLQVPYVLTHVQGTPKTMQNQTDYRDLISDMLRYFAEKIETLRCLGFNKEIIIDPGFGFAKTTAQNFELLRNLSVFEVFNAPILAGISRKSMIYKTLNIFPNDALNGTTAANMMALMNGARILRVHDVREAIETIKIFEKTMLARSEQ